MNKTSTIVVVILDPPTPLWDIRVTPLQQPKFEPAVRDIRRSGHRLLCMLCPFAALDLCEYPDDEGKRRKSWLFRVDFLMQGDRSARIPIIAKGRAREKQGKSDHQGKEGKEVRREVLSDRSRGHRAQE